MLAEPWSDSKHDLDFSISSVRSSSHVLTLRATVYSRGSLWLYRNRSRRQRASKDETGSDNNNNDNWPSHLAMRRQARDTGGAHCQRNPGPAVCPECVIVCGLSWPEMPEISISARASYFVYCASTSKASTDVASAMACCAATATVSSDGLGGKVEPKLLCRRILRTMMHRGAARRKSRTAQ